VKEIFLLHDAYSWYGIALLSGDEMVSLYSACLPKMGPYLIDQRKVFPAGFGRF
jgi:hypothetical protein